MSAENVVLKFGGTSAADPERIAEIYLEDPERNRVAVMSAIGKDYGDTNGGIKVTDALLGLEDAVDNRSRGKTQAKAQATEARDFVIERTLGTYDCLGRAALDRAKNEMVELLKDEHRRDGYAWVGEHISAKLFAELTGATYVSTDLRFSGGFLQLDHSIDKINRNLIPVLATGKQVVTEGFYGFDIRTGRVEVLPRGGSDTSGVIYAGALSQAQPDNNWFNENYTDKDGILSADPQVVEAAKVIPEITHEEVREKMHGVTERNGVIHGDAIAYASRLGVDMVVKNTFNREAPGTHIMSARESDPAHPVIGISGKSDLVALDAFDMGMADAKNYLSAILNKAGEMDVSISNIPTGEDRIKLIFNSGITDKELAELKRYILDRAISGDKAVVDITSDEGAVYLVGQELTHPQVYTQTLGKVATILAEEHLSVREVISHEKSPSLALTVAGQDVDTIVKILHRRLIAD